jgi:hypothetical protein
MRGVRHRLAGQEALYRQGTDADPRLQRDDETRSKDIPNVNAGTESPEETLWCLQLGDDLEDLNSTGTVSAHTDGSVSCR